MQVDRKVLEQALELLQSAHVATSLVWPRHDCVEALKAALEQKDALNTRDPLLTVTPAQMAHAAAVEPCNKSCAPGYCYCEPIIQSKIKVDSWHGLTDEERDYFKACGFVGVSRVEEVLRAKNSTLVPKN